MSQRLLLLFYTLEILFLSFDMCFSFVMWCRVFGMLIFAIRCYYRTPTFPPGNKYSQHIVDTQYINPIMQKSDL